MVRVGRLGALCKWLAKDELRVEMISIDSAQWLRSLFVASLDERLLLLLLLLNEDNKNEGVLCAA